MSYILTLNTLAAAVPAAPASKVALFFDGDVLKSKNDAGVVTVYSSGSGTVSSVDVSGADGIVAAGSPITSSGTIALSLGDITPTSVSTPGDLTLSGVGQLFIADFSNGTASDRMYFETSTVNGNTFVGVKPNGSSTNSGFSIENNSLIGDNGFLGLNISSTEAIIQSSRRGVGVELPLVFRTGAPATTRMTIEVAGNISINNNLVVTGTAAASNLSGTNTGDQVITLTGDVTGSGSSSFAATLASVNGDVGTFTYPSITINAKGLITAASSLTPVTSLSGTVNQITASASTGAITLTIPAVFVVPGTIEGTDITATGNMVISTAGSGLSIKEGSNAKMGQSTLVAGTVTVSTTAVTASSRIFLTHATAGTSPGTLSVGTTIAGTSFDINSTELTDDSIVNWMIVEPA